MGFIDGALSLAVSRPVELGNVDVFLQRLRPLWPHFKAVAPLYGFSAAVPAGIAWIESSYRPDVINSIGCVGLMQICPGNFARFKWSSAAIGQDPARNIAAGCELLLEYYQAEGTLAQALKRYGGFITKDPSDYIAKVTSRMVFVWGWGVLQ